MALFFAWTTPQTNQIPTISIVLYSLAAAVLVIMAILFTVVILRDKHKRKIEKEEIRTSMQKANMDASKQDGAEKSSPTQDSKDDDSNSL